VKLRPVKDDADRVLGYSFSCKGCDCGHVFYVRGALVWEFNGDMDRPTFTPSLLNTCPNHPDPALRRCHLQLTKGQLHYYSDCSHALAGQVVALVDHG
jgi:Family of unknown function (DUF6527)